MNNVNSKNSAIPVNPSSSKANKNTNDQNTSNINKITSIRACFENPSRNSEIEGLNKVRSISKAKVKEKIQKFSQGINTNFTPTTELSVPPISVKNKIHQFSQDFKAKFELSKLTKTQPSSFKKNGAFYVASAAGIHKIQAVLFKGAKIPLDAEKRLREWLETQTPTVLSQSGRIPYSIGDIALALKAFQEECQCSWKVMKAHWEGNQKFMQIINDLRAAYIEQMIHQLKQDFSNLKVGDVGSNKLTSDRDLSLTIEDQRELEVFAVERYNQLFEKTGWGATSAYVFDNNAYTQLYIESLNTEKMQKNQLIQQNIMSLVMFKRNAGADQWNLFKQQLLTAITPKKLDSIKSLIIQIESLSYKLEIEHNAQIIHKGIQSDHTFKADVNQANLAQEIEKINPELIIIVDNELHNEFKKAIKDTLNQRNILDSCVIKMAKAVTHLECIENYHKGLLTSLDFIQQQIQRYKSEKEAILLEIQRLGPLHIKDATFLQEESKKIQKELEYITTYKNYLDSLLKLDSTSFSHTVKHWYLIKKEIYQLEKQQMELDRLPLKIALFHKEKKLLKTKFNAANSSEAQDIQNKIEDINTQLETLKTMQKNKHSLKQELSAKIDHEKEKIYLLPQKDVEILNLFKEMSDRMQIAIELNSMKAQCFAQEAHVSAGAFGFVVKDIQIGEKETRNIVEYLQAINELMGFYYAHQAHIETSYNKLIEVSKYIGPRLMEAYSRMATLTTSLNLSFPLLSKQNDIKCFFTELLSLRGGQIHSDTIEKGLIAINDDKINSIIKQLLTCKSAESVKNVFIKNNISLDKFDLIKHYFINNDEGLSNNQKNFLVKEIAKRYHLPIKKDNLDVASINIILSEMHVAVAAWALNLSKKQQLLNQ